MDGAEGTTMRDRAVALAQAGWPVFQLKPNGKKPQFTGWQDTATCDPHEVHKMWSWPESGNPRHFNIGIAAGVPCAALAGGVLLPVDVDVKEGKRGEATLINLVVDHGLDLTTLTAVSPTGSQHYYYATPEREDARLKNTVSHPKLGDDIDTRGRGGFVVAPGSEINGVAYRWANDLPVKEAPPWLVEVCSIHNTGATAGNGYEESHVDMPGAYERGLLWAVDQAPEAIQGQGGDRTTVVQVAMPLRDMGISEVSAVDILWEYWNPIKAIPPWTHDELQTKVYSAYRSAESAFGSKYREPAELAFSTVEVPDIKCDGLSQLPSATVDKPRLFFRNFEEAAERALAAPNRPLIEDFLDCGTMSVVYGESNTGKTFLALDIAFHVAAGLPWRGKPTTQGPVIYVAAEAGDSINKRVRALKLHYKPDGAVPLLIVPCMVDLFNPRGDLTALLALIREACGAVGPALVVIDTLARAIGGGDESTARDMGLLVRALDTIRVETGAHVMVLHHSGKNKANGARGSSALRAATDTEIEVERGKFWEQKQREYQTPRAPVSFTLQTVELGTTAAGKKVRSCAVAFGQHNDFLKIGLTPIEQAWVDRLMEWGAKEKDRRKAAGERSEEIALTQKQVEEIIFGCGYEDAQPTYGGTSQSVINRRLFGLCEKRWIGKNKQGQWVISELCGYPG